jgi:hypothetical protein
MAQLHDWFGVGAGEPDNPPAARHADRRQRRDVRQQAVADAGVIQCQSDGRGCPRVPIRQLHAVEEAGFGKDRETIQAGGGGKLGDAQQTEFGQARDAGWVDQFAGEPAVVVLTGLDDQDRPAECRKGGGGGTAGDPTPGDDGIDVDGHAASLRTVGARGVGAPGAIE